MDRKGSLAEDVIGHEVEAPVYICEHAARPDQCDWEQGGNGHEYDSYTLGFGGSLCPECGHDSLQLQ